MATRTCCLLLAAGLLGMVLTGCCGLRLGKVSGRVTVGGKPVPRGTILFYPEAGPTAVGAIRPDGTYTLTTQKPGDGAVVGAHRVTIQATNVGPGSMVEAKSFEEEVERARKGTGKRQMWLVPGKVDWIVPEKYSRVQTTTLTAKVDPGSNTVNFDIPEAK
jgi:hypothetical protein